MAHQLWLTGTLSSSVPPPPLQHKHMLNRPLSPLPPTFSCKWARFGPQPCLMSRIMRMNFHLRRFLKTINPYCLGLSHQAVRSVSSGVYSCPSYKHIQTHTLTDTFCKMNALILWQTGHCNWAQETVTFWGLVHSVSQYVKLLAMMDIWQSGCEVVPCLLAVIPEKNMKLTKAHK